MDKNILISGWPGAGATALSMILTKNFGYTLLRGTETFRELGRRMSKSNTGKDRIEVDEYLEPYFGPVFDKYIDYKLLNGQKYIIEADIGAFRLGKRKEYFSIFITAEREVRMQRLSVDKRIADQAMLKEREDMLRQSYLELHKIDWFSIKQINEKYSLIVDNSNKTIAEELTYIYSSLFDNNCLLSEEYNILKSKSISDDKEYWTNGKDWYLKMFRDNSQLMDGTEVLNEILTLFKKDIDKFPLKLKNVMLLD